MKLSLIYQIPLLALASLFLFSCGTSSNGVFEKRKHLKGWNFKKKKNLSVISPNSKNEQSFSSKNIVTESDINRLREAEKSTLSYEIEDSSSIDFSNTQKPLSKKSTKKAYSITLRKDQHVLKNQFVEIKNHHDLLTEKQLNSRSVDNNLLIEEKSNVPNKPTNTIKEPDDPKEELVLSPSEITMGIIALYFLYCMYIIGLIIICIPFFMAGVFEIAVPLIIFGIFIGFIYFSYRILRLFRKKDVKEKWTLKRTFLILGLSLLPLYIYVLYAFAQII